jgi:hypothetical protein
MGTAVRGTATDEQINRERERVQREQQDEQPKKKRRDHLTIDLSPHGCSSPGAERWNGYGWVYCLDRRKCRADATIRDRQIKLEHRKTHADLPPGHPMYSAEDVEK